MEYIRAFFAISLPISTRDALGKIIDVLQCTIPLHTVRWTALENLHITLQFLPKLECEHIPELVENVTVKLNKIPEFQLELGNLELFPTPYHAQIISLQVGPDDILKEIAATIRHQIKALNYPVETRPFRAHITLGRLCDAHCQYALDTIHLPILPKPIITDICLFESKTCKQTSNYQILEQFALHSNKTTT